MEHRWIDSKSIDVVLFKKWTLQRKSANSAIKLAKNFQIKVNWNIEHNENLSHWILYKKYGETWETEILEPEKITSEINKMKGNLDLEIIAIRAVDRIGNESDYTALKII